MTLYYADPEAGANIPVKTRTVSGEQVPGHDVIALPGTVEADLAALAAAISNLATIVANQAPPSAIYGGKKTITTAGLRDQIQASSQALLEGVWVRALDANAGLVYVGNASVSATAAGTRLASKEAIFIRVDNLNKVYIDVATNGEGVTFLGW